MNWLTREEARVKLLASWLETRTKLELLGMSEPNWERLRNYEIESRLHKEFGGEWGISEPCPFNGPFCSFGREQGLS